MRSPLGRRIAVADAFGVGAPVGIFAVAVLAEVAPLALAAHERTCSTNTRSPSLKPLRRVNSRPAFAMVPMFSWPHDNGALDGGVLYSFTSVPQIPATSSS